MSKVIQKVLTSKNEAVVKEQKAAREEKREAVLPQGFTFQGGPEDAPGEADEITVVLDITVPETLEEAASEDFYGSESAAMEAVQEDWARRCVNAARGPIRTSEVPQAWQTFGQSIASAYKPGRRGGFAPRVSADDVANAGFEMSAELVAFLKAQGALK